MADAFVEWKRKKKKEEEEKKAELTAKEKAMGGDEGEVDAFVEWKRKQKANATEDIAPVAGGKKDSWVKSGGFSDGVDGVGDFFGDLGQTTAGTVGDVILGATVGFGRMFEGLYDLGVQGVSRAADALGADEFAKSAKEHANRDLMGEWAKDKLDYVDQYSVLGDKADSVAQGLGQVGGIILTGNAGAAAGLGAGGVSALTTATTGLSSMGTNIGEAYNAGATDDEAFVYGLTTGAIEAGTELFFGGLGKGVKALGLSRGIGGVDDMLAKGLSNKITKLIAKDSVKKVVGNTIEALVKATGEGVEEVASGLGSALMKKLTYASEEEWEKLVADEKLLESFIVGAVTSGIMQGGDYAKSLANKTDFVTGHTASEEKVIQRATEQEIAKREANGEKLTKKQKNEIYDKLTEDISRGYISIDTIEEALGGDKYAEYKKASDENAALKKELDELRTLSEYDSLRNMKSGDRTDIQNDRLAELKGKNLSDMTEEQKSRLAELEAKYGENTKTLEDMKKQMSDDVLNLVKSERKGQGSLLMESYNEKARLGQGFVANYDSIKGKKYEDAARKTIDNAIKAGANNSNRVHDLVDMTAKFSSETGVVYEFGGNEQIKTNFINRQNEKIAALEAVENPTEAQIKELANLKDLVSKVESGKTTVNGNISKSGNIIINLDSPKALETVVGHEMAHLLENAKKNGGKLQNAVLSYAKAKGIDLEAKIAEYTEIYNGVEGADAKGELTADLIGDYLFNDYDFVKTLAADRNLFQKMWDGVKYLGKLATAGSHEARELARVERMFEKAYQEVVKNGGVETKSPFTDADGQPIDAARISSDESDNSYSLSHNAEIAEGQSKYIVDHKAFVTESELAEAQRVTNAMVDVMIKYSNILPEDKIGKVLTKNGSYDRSVENTTICVRTLAYNEFVDRVQEEIGRPLSQMESFLVSQKLFVIATDPQCMYCYVSLDRKAFNDMLLRYMHDRDSVMEKYRSGEWEDVNTYTEEQIKKMTAEQKAKSLYVDYLRGRDATKNQADRFNTWLGYVDNGTQILSLADIATEDRQSAIKANGGDLANQLADARKYAQSASWAKIQKDYVAYRDEILKLGDKVVKNLNQHYGLRWYSFSDYSAAFIVENMQQITDASIRGLKGLAYTKDTDFAEIYAPSGMNINVSVFVKKNANGEYYIDERQSANFEKALDLRGQYPNVGIVATVTDDDALKWAASQEWSDVIIPFHIVKTGTDVADYYKWLNYTGESSDVVANKDLWNAYLDSLNIKSENARKKVSKNVYPSEHHNDKDTYLNLCESRGLTPRFARFVGEDWYMKLVNETRLSADKSTPLKPIYNEEAAKASFQKFVDKGGYEGGWYKEGVDVDAEAKAVAEDILAGKKANEVDYGRQDIAPEELIATRKTNRKHGQYSLSNAEDIAPIGNRGILGRDFRVQEDIAPLTMDNVDTMGGVDTDIYPNAPTPTDADAPAARKGEKDIDTKSMFVDPVKKEHKKANWWNTFRTHVLDDASVFEDLAKKTKNRELESKFNFIKSAEARAQSLIGNGKKEAGVKSLNSIRQNVEKMGKTAEFEDYMYHLLNVDRMTLADRYEGVTNKPVFDRDITSDISEAKVRQYEAQNPQFKSLAEDVYKYMQYERQLMVDNGIISQETADLWQEQTPHYIPIKRSVADDSPVNTSGKKKINVDSTVKRVKGGDQPIEHLFDTIASRTERVFSSIAKNNFGLELKNTLNSVIDSNTATQDDVDNGVDRHDDLLQAGKDGRNPTFTVFENGEKVTFEISHDMYEALKPTDAMWKGTSKALNKINNIRRGLLTEYSIPFLVSNSIRDAQSVLNNSQHAVQTYGNFPEAARQLATKGKWATEYLENGGESLTYFDTEKGFTKDDTGIKKLIGIPLNAISNANQFIERIPRLAEYIASRENGASIETAMLDAARVTTNFQAGGDITKFLNRNGFTFLNASVQGLMQNVRNIREAKMNGLKGVTQLIAKTMLQGLPAILLNHLFWGDDEEYEELSDYVKDNYYIIAKYGDGKFVRIPKGREAAVIQDAFEQMANLITGNDEVDLESFFELVMNNLAPNNPLENNIIAPLTQAWSNTTWYGDDLVPTRLQDLPAGEQYDESIDAISKWLGEKTNISPYKINYVLDQYSGAIGDFVLPMLTPEAERGENALLAPIADKFTTDSTMKNQNVSDFYDTVDKLSMKANSSKATDEDILKSKYMNSINSELSELYKQKREIQNSTLSDTAKYNAVRDIQKQINDLAENSLKTYNAVYVHENYARVGDRHYHTNSDGEWEKISDKQFDKMRNVTSELGISRDEYWGNKEEYDYAYDYPEKYAVSKVVGGYDAYKKHTTAINKIEGVKDANGKTKSGSRKTNVINYINDLDIGYVEKLILFRSEYPADDTYNSEIVKYLQDVEWLTYQEKLEILSALGMKVDQNGYVRW